MRLTLLCIALYLLTQPIANSQSISDDLQYLGQTPPALTPEIFAPGLISKNDEYEFGSVFNKDATAFFYGVDINGKAEIRYSELMGKKWSMPKTILSDEVYGYNDPFFPLTKRDCILSPKRP